MAEDHGSGPISVCEEVYFEEQKELATQTKTTLLLQFGSPTCERCPAFADAIADLGATYKFTWLYCNAHDPDQDLTEAFEITKLPAFVLYTPGSSQQHVVANASPEHLTAAFKERCTPVLTLDADF